MKINSIHIQNFRKLQLCTIDFSEKETIFVGANNSGKTTILEAISLWSEIFNYLLTKTKRSYESLNLSLGEYRFGQKSNNYFDYRKINFFVFRSYFFVLKLFQRIYNQA